MKRVQKIWAELSKQLQEEPQLKEWQQDILKKEILNLSSVSDLKKYLSEVNSAIELADTALSQINDAEKEFEEAKANITTSITRFQNARGDAAQVAFEAFDALIEFENKVKELGLSASDVPEYSELEKAGNKLMSLNKQLDDKNATLR